jgi:hypothetical protein
MTMSTIADQPDVYTLVAVIARSQIVVTAPVTRLPADYDDTDVAILDWLASEGRRVRRALVWM